MFKKILFAVLTLALVGGFIGYRMWTKPQPNVTESHTDLTVKAAQLYSDFEADENKANATYLEKVVQVTGIVDTVSEENGQRTVLLQGGEGATSAVSCTLDTLSKMQDWRTLTFKKGESVTLKGIVKGKLMDVQISRCVSVK
jgi:hypothetical protein